jgi:hypothetical protein
MLAFLIWGKMEIAPYHNYVARTIQEAGKEGLDWRRTGASRVLEVLVARDWKESRPPIIWSANCGWVDGNTISWEAVKQGLPWKVYNMGTIFGLISALVESHFSPQTGVFLVPNFADFIIVPAVGITGEIETPHGIHDWNSIIASQGKWALLGEVKAPKGVVSIYRNQVPLEKRDFSTATAWIRMCNTNIDAL